VKRQKPILSIILVTMDTPTLTSACLKSLFKNTSIPFEVIVVNNSKGQAIDQTLHEYPIHRMIQNPSNHGYARAANQGAAIAKGNFFCFLNSDTLVPPQWAERLIIPFKSSRAGAVNPIANDCGYPFPFPPHPLKIDPTTVSLIDEAVQIWHSGKLERMNLLSGFCFFISQAVMKHIGPFDETFYFGLDDDDYSLRLRMAGYRLFRVHSVFVYHKWSGSITESKRKPWVEKAEIAFIHKWTNLLGQSFSSRLQINRWIDQHYPVDKSPT